MLDIILKTGALLCGIGGVLIVGSQMINVRMWLDCYPRAIQEAVPPRTKREKRLKLIPGIPFMLALAGLPVLAAVIYTRTALTPPGFLDYFLIVFGTSFMFNLFDLIVLDWMIFCLITPRYQVVEGSEHILSEYKNYAFHLRGIYIGGAMGVVYSLAAAGVLSLVF